MIKIPFKAFKKFLLLEDKFKLNTISFDVEKSLVCLQSKDHLNRISRPTNFMINFPIPNAIKDVIEEKIENNFEPSAM